MESLLEEDNNNNNSNINNSNNNNRRSNNNNRNNNNNNDNNSIVGASVVVASLAFQQQQQYERMDVADERVENNNDNYNNNNDDNNSNNNNKEEGENKEEEDSNNNNNNNEKDRQQQQQQQQQSAGAVAGVNDDNTIDDDDNVNDNYNDDDDDDDDDGTNNVPPASVLGGSGSGIPVGITIAYKRRNLITTGNKKLLLDELQNKKKKKNNTNNKNNNEAAAEAAAAAARSSSNNSSSSTENNVDVPATTTGPDGSQDNNKNKKHHHKQKRKHKRKTDHRNKEVSKSNHNHNKNTNNSSGKRYKKPVASFTVFVEGTTVYILCLLLPTIIGFLYHCYIVWKYDRENAIYTFHLAIKDTLQSLTHTVNVYVDTICSYPAAATSSSSSSSSSPTTYSYYYSNSNEEEPQEQQNQIIVVRFLSKLVTYITRMIITDLSWLFDTTGLCDRIAIYLQEEDGDDGDDDVDGIFVKLSSSSNNSKNWNMIYSDDTSYWVQDITNVVLCCMVLALLRIYIVQTNVPLKDSTTVEALVRCKSIHLLSSQYVGTMTPVATTPRKIIRTIRTITSNDNDNNNNNNQFIMAPFLIPNLEDNNNNNDTMLQHDHEEPDALQSQYHHHIHPYEYHQYDTGSHDDDVGEGDDLGMRWDEDTERYDDDDDDTTNNKNITTNTTTTTTTTNNNDNILQPPSPPFMMRNTSSKLNTTTPVSTATISTSALKIGDYNSWNDDDDDDDDRRNPLVPTSAAEATTADSTMMALHESFTILEQQQQQTRTRLFAAPRYATALFRLLWSTISLLLAIYYFRKSNFWPWYIGGSGKTANCWDLSGGISVGGMFDSDYDHYNTVLKRYFLGQASYHWHSGAFHILSMVLLLLHPSSSVKSASHHDVDDIIESDALDHNDQQHQEQHEQLLPARPLSPTKVERVSTIRLLFGNSSAAYIRSMAQHMLALALMASAYLFSSLRRLGVIGMFAFDFSNWFLHLLQICINAPPDSKLKQNNVVTPIYWYGVIPSFIITRFIIFPLLWYSAIFESKVWLIQLEKTLWIGSATLLRCIFHIWMLVIQLLNMVYFYRLLHHPHLHKILKQQQNQTERNSSSIIK